MILLVVILKGLLFYMLRCMRFLIARDNDAVFCLTSDGINIILCVLLDYVQIVCCLIDSASVHVSTSLCL